MIEAVDSAEEALERARALEKADDLDGAIAAMSEAVDADPDSIKYRALRGRLLSMRKKWRAAIRDFDSVLAVKANAPTILYSRGRARTMIGDFAGAIADLEGCIALEPTAADAYREIGYIRYYHRELEPALSAFRKALELDPEHYSGLTVHIADIEQALRGEGQEPTPGKPCPTAGEES